MCAECLLEFGGTGGEGGVAREVGDAHRESVVYVIRSATRRRLCVLLGRASLGW